MRKTIFLLLFLTSSLVNLSQKVKIELKTLGNIDQNKILNNLPGEIVDSLKALQKVRDGILELRENGFLLANIDKIQTSSPGILTFYLNIGNKYSWISLGKGNVPQEILGKTMYSTKLFRGPVRPGKVGILLNQIIRNSESAGFPFAYVKIDSLEILKDGLKGELYYEPGPLITFDTLKIKGDTRIKSNFLSAYLDLKPGNMFNQKKIDEINRRLSELDYINVTSSPEITFQNEQASIILHLQDRKVSTINGIIGFLPNESENKKLLITGEIDLELKNPFGTGKEIAAKWQKIREETQLMDLHYLHPNFLRSSVNIYGDFDFLKEDTSFFNIEATLGLSFTPQPAQALSLYSTIHSGRLNSTSGLGNSVELPPFSDFNITYYGIQYGYSSILPLIFPLKGFSLSLNFAVGRKRIKKNSGINESLYEGLDLNSTQLRTTARLKKLWRISQRSVIFNEVNAGKLINKRLFLNDIFRLGGLGSLRGFNENFFFASEYISGKIEWRYLIENETYFFVFFDKAFIKVDVENQLHNDAPFGLGTGISLDTNNGIFHLVYAIGGSEDQDFSFEFSKIHFGYKAKF